MNRLQQAALLTALADKLHKKGSWCGETHLQKAVYFLEELLQVPLGFEFILYKHGPFSFELRDELTALRADALLELRPQPEPYGPSLLPTPASAELRERYPKTLGKYSNQLEFLAKKLGGKRVSELERLATALYVTGESSASGTAHERAGRIHDLKPHVSIAEAMAAVSELDRLTTEARDLKNA